MAKTRYTVEEKEKALQLCNEVGVLKASEETGITTKTLYTWRASLGEKAPVAAAEGGLDLSDEAKAEGEDAVSADDSAASPRKRYTAGEKAEALRLCDEIGITKASKKTGIAYGSLQKWRNAAVGEGADTTVSVTQTNEPQSDDSSAIMNRDKVDELIRLRTENSALKAQLQSLKNALRAFTE